MRDARPTDTALDLWEFAYKSFLCEYFGILVKNTYKEIEDWKDKNYPLD